MRLILYQTEWCPYSHRVRQRLTELGLEFTVKQVPVERSERSELLAETGQDRIPALVLDGGPPICGSQAIVVYLSERFDERPDAGKHRAKASDRVPSFEELEARGGEWTKPLRPPSPRVGLNTRLA